MTLNLTLTTTWINKLVCCYATETVTQIIDVIGYLFGANAGHVRGEVECKRAGRTTRRWRNVLALRWGVWRQRRSLGILAAATSGAS